VIYILNPNTQEDTLPVSTKEIWSKYPRIEPPALIMGDIHIPYHHAQWMEKVVRIGKRYKIRKVIIPGDLFEMKYFSRFPKLNDSVVEEEIDICRQILNWLKSQFREVHVFPGNHDERLARKLEGKIRFKKFLEWITYEAINVYEHHQVYVGNTWLIAHPGNYSQTNTEPAKTLAEKFHKNVAVGHTHKWSMGKDRSGKYWAIEIGMCADYDRIEWLHRELTKHPIPQLGALIIDINEKPILLHNELI